MSDTPELAPAFVKAVRQACKHFAKPDYLGALSLAAEALRARLTTDPHHPLDQVGRGLALQHALRVCLDRMKDLATTNYDEKTYFCLYAYIHKKDARTGAAISNVAVYCETNYNLSHTAYFERQKEGIAQLSAHLSAYLAQRAALYDPIPRGALFVGREAELRRYQDALAADRVVVIQGAPGIGKTALGAQLAAAAQAEARPVCWLTFRQGINTSVAAALHAWAAFLAQHDAPHLWALLHADGHTQTAPQRAAASLKTGVQRIRPLLCLDNLEAWATDADDWWALLDILWEETPGALLLISQRPTPRPAWNREPPLDGLPPADIRTFLRAQACPLPPDAATLPRLVDYTGGNPRALEWLITRARALNTMPGECAEQLAILLHAPRAPEEQAAALFTALTPGEQHAARLLALSRRPLDSYRLLHDPGAQSKADPAEGKADKALLDDETSPEEDIVLDDDDREPDGLPLSAAGITPRDFAELNARRLIHVTPGDQWELTPVLRDYLLTHPAPEAAQTQLYHHCLVRLHTYPLEIVYHHIQSGAGESALAAAQSAFNTLIGQGQAAALLALLQTLASASFNADAGRQLWREQKIALAQLLGDYPLAEVEAQAALAEAETPLQKARALRRLGGLTLAQHPPAAAAQRYQEAIALLEAQTLAEETWLYRDLAWAWGQAGALPQAQQALTRAEMALENTKAILYKRQGDFEAALIHLERAVDLAQAQRDWGQLLRARNNRAAIYRELEQYDDALAEYRHNLTLSIQTDELVAQAITALNLGICHLWKTSPDPAAAIRRETEALELFEELGDITGAFLAHTNLAEAHLAAGDLAAAQQHAETGLAHCDPPFRAHSCAERYRLCAEIHLALGTCEAASEHLERAQHLIYPHGLTESPLDQAIAQRIAEAQAKLQQYLSERR